METKTLLTISSAVIPPFSEAMKASIPPAIIIGFTSIGGGRPCCTDTEKFGAQHIEIVVNRGFHFFSRPTGHRV